MRKGLSRMKRKQKHRPFHTQKKTKQNKTKQKQNKTKTNKKQNKTKQNKTKQTKKKQGVDLTANGTY